MKILGISAFYHDSAAALVVDGDIVAAAQEERFTRKKHDAAFPEHAIAYCLRRGDVGADGRRRGRLLRQADHDVRAPAEDVPPRRPEGDPLVLVGDAHLGTREAVDPVRDRAGPRSASARRMPKNMWFTEHHESHAASAFFPSPFEHAAILTFDGVGEWATSSIGVGRGNQIELQRQLNFPNSLGLLYSAFTYFCGFRVNSGEYKLMGLAPYGEPVYVDRIFDHLVDLRPDGSFRMEMKYFNYLSGLTMTNRRFADLFDGPPRDAGVGDHRARARPGRVDPGRHRGDRAQHGARARRRPPARATRAWPAGSR